jgi:FkbM family methyltransferase
MFCLRGFAAELSNLLAVTLGPGATFIDIGAHIGWFSTLAAERIGAHGRVVAVEPEPTNFAQLMHNLSGALCKVETHALALGNNDCEVFLEKGEYSNLHSLRRTNAHDRGWRVRMTTGDLLFADLADVDYVKIDVEGLELGVILGMTECLRRWSRVKVLMEFNPELWQTNELLTAERILGSLGFQVWSIERLPPWSTRLPRLYRQGSLCAARRPRTCDFLIAREPLEIA